MGDSSTPRVSGRGPSTWPASGSAWSGIGATGIQVIQTIADEVGHLTVFARTPQYVLPMKNPTYWRPTRRPTRARFDELHEHDPAHLHRVRVRLRARLGRLHARAAAGDPRGDLPGRVAEAVAGRLRRDVLRRGGQRGGLGVRPGEDARPAQGPAADRHPGADRLRLRHPPRPAGDATTSRSTTATTSSWSACGTTRSPGSAPRGSSSPTAPSHELDVIILATGFDAGTGALTRIDIRGRDGRSLTEEWGRDIRTTMGLMVARLPEPAHHRGAAGPVRGAVQHDHLPAAADRVDQRHDSRRARAGQVGDRADRRRARTPGSPTTRRSRAPPSCPGRTPGTWARTCPGKPRRLLSYIGGVGTYRQKCERGGRRRATRRSA